MGNPLSQGYKEKSQKHWDSLINKKPIKVEQENVKPRPILFSHAEYDTLQPEDKIRDFCAFIRQALSQYSYNKEELVKIENKQQDIMHFIELTKDKDAFTGYKLYKELCELCRERRKCKSEMELLAPVYEMFNGTNLLDQLASVQGSCRKAKQTIANKGYTVRTDAIDDFIN